MNRRAFNPAKMYGDIVLISDQKQWKELVRRAASIHVPRGTEILIAHNGEMAAWRYPYDATLVPFGWTVDRAFV